MFTRQQFLEFFVLASAGLLLSSIGMSITLSPESFYAVSGIDIGQSASLRSELRAPAVFLFMIGLMMMAALWLKQLRANVLLLAALLFLSYAVARMIGMASDGIPSQTLVEATVIEWVAGVLCAWAYAGHRLEELGQYCSFKREKQHAN